MTTARDIVNGALQRIRVVGISSSSVPAEYQDYVLGMLNDMLHGWQTQGIDLKISDLGINDTFWFIVPPSGIAGETVDAMASQGNWDASTNTPTLASGTGTEGHYYRVSVAGTTTLDDESSWSVDDALLFDGSTWRKCQSSRKHVGGIIDLLAADIANDFGKEPGRRLSGNATQAWYALAADFMIPNTATWDQALYRTSTRRYWSTA